MASVRFVPPPFNQQMLCNLVIEQYQSHASCKDVIATLVSEYVKLWRLVLSFPNNRVVATGCILAVQQVHQSSDRNAYFYDCMQYFNRYVSRRDFAWFGNRDIRGTLDTMSVYSQLYGIPPEPWNEMRSVYELKRGHLRRV
jgi:hypothetical protein